MKMNRIAGMALAGLCVFGATDACAEDSVAVMKIDSLSPSADKAADALLSALRREVTNSEYMLDANGSDITYTEMQMVTGCDRDGSIGCYEAACETLGSKAIIFGSVTESGDAHIVWFMSGKGIFREVRAKLTDKAAVDKAAKEMVIGEVGQVIVTSNIPGADVFIDGKRVGMSAEYEENAQPIELVTGNYVVAVRKDGYTKEDAVKITVVGGEVARVHVDMNVATDPEEIRKGVKIGGFASLGAGVALVAAGGTLLGLLGKPGKGGWDGNGSWWEKHYVRADIESGKGTVSNGGAGDKVVAGIVLVGAGGFLVAAGIALTTFAYVYDFEGEDVDKAYSNSYIPKVDVSLTPDYQGMSLGWTF